jgi:radical SAM superfamily enzyme YgiQ (UPF0313 family)
VLAEFRLTPTEEHLIFNLKSSSLSLSLDGREVYSFDLSGKLLTFWDEDKTYIRTLDNRIVKKWRQSQTDGVWKRVQELEKTEKRKIIERVCDRLKEVLRHFEKGQMGGWGEKESRKTVLDQITSWLKIIVSWDYARLENERKRFRAVYSPVTILPPDQYLALVLQATEGCKWNHCTFCQFYRKSSFRIKSEAEFTRHIQAAKDFFGEAIRLRRSIFLGDANAIAIPQSKLLKQLDRINESFPMNSDRASGCKSHFFSGICSFLDVFTGEKKTEEDFGELRERNLRRVYVGVETGCDELLRFLNKPATARRTLEVCLAVKGAGLSLGVIVMIGIGGSRFLHRHIEQTTELLNSMGLGPGDILFFSPFVESDSMDYSVRAAEAGIGSLTEREREFQLNAIRSALSFEELQKPKISLYDIKEFVY